MAGTYRRWAAGRRLVRCSQAPRRHDNPKLRGPYRVAEGDDSRRVDLQNNATTAARRTIWTHIADATSSGFDTFEYCGGRGPRHRWAAAARPEHLVWVAAGT